MSTYQRFHSGSMAASGRLCRPSAMKLTASTMTTASISMRTNSLTELDTARGWSCTCTSLMPAGRPSSIRSVAVVQRLAQRG